MKGIKHSPLWELQNRQEKSGICAMCKEKKELTVDHIFPVSLMMSLGLREEVYKDEYNLELLCRTCQLLKGNNFNFHNPKTIPLIEKYIQILKDRHTKQ